MRRWTGCPSHEKALADLRRAMAGLGLDPSSLAVHEIETQVEAAAAGFPGSPTIRIDGADLDASDEEPQLNCRIYRRRDGRISPTPDPADVRDALAAAQTDDPRRNQ